MQIKNFVTRKRSITINRKLLRRKIYVYTGKTVIVIRITKNLYGTKLGAMSLTKKLGKTIHGSKRNKKRKLKEKNIFKININNVKTT